MKDRHFWVLICTAAFLVLLVLTGCASPVQATSQQLRIGFASVNAVIDGCAMAVDRDRITLQEGMHCREVAMAAGQILVAAARSAKVGDIQSAQTQIEYARLVLTEIERRLKEREAKGLAK